MGCQQRHAKLLNKLFRLVLQQLTVATFSSRLWSVPQEDGGAPATGGQPPINQPPVAAGRKRSTRVKTEVVEQIVDH